MARPTQPAGQVKQSGRDELVWQALLSTPALPLIMLVYLGKMIANAVVGVMSGSTKESPVTPAEDGLKGAKEIVAEFEQAVVKAQTGNKFQELIAMKRKMWDSHTVARNYINDLYNKGKISPEVVNGMGARDLQAIEDVMAAENPNAYAKWAFQDNQNNGHAGLWKAMKFFTSDSPGASAKTVTDTTSTARSHNVQYRQWTPDNLFALVGTLDNAEELCAANESVKNVITKAIREATRLAIANRDQTGTEESRLAQFEQFIGETLNSLGSIILTPPNLTEAQVAAVRAAYADCIDLRDGRCPA